MIRRKLNRLVLLLSFAIILSPAIRSASGAWARSDKSSESESQPVSQQKVKADESAKESRDGEGWCRGRRQWRAGI